MVEPDDFQLAATEPASQQSIELSWCHGRRVTHRDRAIVTKRGLEGLIEAQTQMCLFSRHRLPSHARSGPQHLDRALSTALSPKSGDKPRLDEHEVITHRQHKSLFRLSSKVDQTVDPNRKLVGEIPFLSCQTTQHFARKKRSRGRMSAEALVANT